MLSEPMSAFIQEKNLTYAASVAKRSLTQVLSDATKAFILMRYLKCTMCE